MRTELDSKSTGNSHEEIIYLLANALEHWDIDKNKAKMYLEAAITKAEGR